MHSCESPASTSVSLEDSAADSTEQLAAVPAPNKQYGKASMATNEALVASGLSRFRTPLSIFVCTAIKKEYGESWWTEGVLETLVHDRMPTVEDVRRFRKLPAEGSLDECAASIDTSVCLVLLTRHWPRIFGQLLDRELRGWAYELIGVRNENKHLVDTDHPSDYAWRALDTMVRVCDPIDAATAVGIRTLRSSVDLSVYGQVRRLHPTRRRSNTLQPPRLERRRRPPARRTPNSGMNLVRSGPTFRDPTCAR